MDFREVYKGVKGACASCKHARSADKPGSIRNAYKLRPYEGGQKVFCALGKFDPAYYTFVNYPPREDLPIGNKDCWEEA